jgi:hypothetical protein
VAETHGGRGDDQPADDACDAPGLSEVAVDHVGVLDPALAATVDEASSDENLVGAVLVLIEDGTRHHELAPILQAPVRRRQESLDALAGSGEAAVEQVLLFAVVTQDDVMHPATTVVHEVGDEPHRVRLLHREHP